MDEILKDLEERFYNIPFENSDFQNRNFLIAAQHTPARAYRAIGLRMFAKIRAIEELKYGRQREDVDIDEWQSIIDSDSSSSFAKRRAAIDIEQKLKARNFTDKLLNDAICELNLLQSELEKLPKYTREEFELEEQHHFETKLLADIKNSQHPSLISLQAMSDYQKLENGS
jgi:hypothetical protein